MKLSLPAAVLAFASRLRFPTLFALTAALFVADLFIPDVVPMADELLLGLATAALAAWRKKKDGTDGEGEGAIPETSEPPTV